MPDELLPRSLDPRCAEISAISQRFVLDPDALPKTQSMGPFRVPAGTWIVGVIHIESIDIGDRVWLDIDESNDGVSWEELGSFYADSPGKSLISFSATQGTWIWLALKSENDGHAPGHLELLILPGKLPAALQSPPASEDDDRPSCPRSVIPLAPFRAIQPARDTRGAERPTTLKQTSPSRSQRSQDNGRFA